MTGIGTVLADDPAMNARPGDLAIELLQPVRLILDSTLRTPPAAASLALPGAVIVFAGDGTDPAMTARRRQLEARGVRIETVSAAPRLDLAAVAQRLGTLEINTVWLEAGPRLAGAMLAAGLVDELVLYLAPCLLGSDARGLFELPALSRLEDRHALKITGIRQFGEDLRICARIERR
jgi:diaminohydroxyphosphoribosylaminopyrimidine deaminase/5-amino-6-(5-phosphoribosylamino)uracil reductase